VALIVTGELGDCWLATLDRSPQATRNTNLSISNLLFFSTWFYPSHPFNPLDAVINDDTPVLLS
jgi:hypothetical protein